ncbi:solute carrier family 12 member 8-like isoform X2 [Tubulanus polymorphus]|uniref:solute carrier family 12 member 8-like isoform X2 n=1 Tax=Tubulanus polymorphus TaxID=672921 RepID=UPI003DA69FB5
MDEPQWTNSWTNSGERSPLLIMTTTNKKDVKSTPDWSRYGLSVEQRNEAENEGVPQSPDAYSDSPYHHDKGNENELFREDSNLTQKPWWKTNFFIVEPVLFGTWDGVFTSCMLNIFGVVIFLRTGWMVGNAGIGLSLVIILVTIFVAMISVISAIGVCERCKMESGGVYFLLSHVLGAKIGTSIGIVYCFGQAVACSLYVVGFGESIAALINQQNEWVSRGIAIGVLLLLLGINVAGVKWVIRLQLILLFVLFVAVLDFLVGSFVHTDIENGVLGYTITNLHNNTGPSYMEGQSFFTVFGVFFPTATGVFAGINMSGDLSNPGRNIPVGTLSAVGVSTFLYLSFTVVLGSVCGKAYLQTDYMIAQKVAIVGYLWLAGLYVSSISSSMGAIYGSPRILQSIANENTIPIIKCLGRGVAVFGPMWLCGLYVSSMSAALGAVTGSPRVLQAVGASSVIPIMEHISVGRGPNKVPVYSLIVITLISLVFILFGEVNTLGPIVTMPFMLTYAAVDYAYFALAMSFDIQKTREERFSGRQPVNGKVITRTDSNGAVTDSAAAHAGYGATIAKTKDKNNDLDTLFPERVRIDPTQPQIKRQPSGDSEIDRSGSIDSHLDDTSKLLGGKEGETKKKVNTEIVKLPRSWYSFLCNRWLSIFGMFACFVIMFAIMWIYALATILVTIVIYFYITKTNPGVFPGIADFNLWIWLKERFQNCCRGPPPPEQIVVTPNTPAMNTMAAQLTEDNDDFAERGRYHQSQLVRGDQFDD